VLLVPSVSADDHGRIGTTQDGDGLVGKIAQSVGDATIYGSRPGSGYPAWEARSGHARAQAAAGRVKLGSPW
jgi:hypothetical protein